MNCSAPLTYLTLTDASIWNIYGGIYNLYSINIRDFMTSGIRVRLSALQFEKRQLLDVSAALL